MNFRARLSLFALESRENPSVPVVPPVGGDAPPPTDPAVIAEGACVDGATIPPAGGNNTVYNTPPVTLP